MHRGSEKEASGQKRQKSGTLAASAPVVRQHGYQLLLPRCPRWHVPYVQQRRTARGGSHSLQQPPCCGTAGTPQQQQLEVQHVVLNTRARSRTMSGVQFANAACLYMASTSTIVPLPVLKSSSVITCAKHSKHETNAANRRKRSPQQLATYQLVTPNHQVRITRKHRIHDVLLAQKAQLGVRFKQRCQVRNAVLVQPLQSVRKGHTGQ